MLGWSSGEAMVPTVVQVAPRLVERCTSCAVSVMELSFQVRTARRLLPPAFCSVLLRPFGATGGKRQRLRPHHVHLFVAQDVAVPHVAPAEVDELVGDGVGERVALRVDAEEELGRARPGPSG